MKKKRNRVICAVLAVLWTACIWGQSLMSSDLSSWESTSVVTVVNNTLSGMGLSLSLTENMVRKTAHFLEYMILGILVSGAVLNGTLRNHFYKLGFTLILVPLLDETIQLFIEGRSGAIQDVWLDFAGCCAGAAVFLLIRLVVSHKRRSS